MKSAVIGPLFSQAVSAVHRNDLAVGPARSPWTGTRLRPPAHPALCVTREALLARLDRATRGRLVVLVAPAGSGKTTLLGQWHADARARCAVAWLSLGGHHHTHDTFFGHLQAALSDAVPGFEAVTTDDGEVPLPRFVDQLDRLDQAVTIVLDGFDAIDDVALSHTIDALLQHSPAQVHWVIASRRGAGLSVSQLQLQDQCTVFGAGDLAFSAADVATLGRLAGRSLGTDEVDFILRATEGWCAGVKLALLSADTGAADSEPLLQFTGAHRRMVRYFDDVVLRGLPADVRRFLLVTAIADKLSGDLCNALLGISDGSERLERLVQSPLFVQPLDSHGRWYRYHPLFLAYLRERLKRELPEQLSALHLTASRWFDVHGMQYQALPHAFAAQDRAWCLEVMERCAVAWTNDGEPLEVLRWSALLTRDEIVSRGDICCAYILSLVLSHRLAEARAIVRLAMVQVDRPDGVQPRETRDLVRYRLRVLGRLVNGEAWGDLDALEGGPRGDGQPEEFFTGILIVAQTSTLLGRNQFEAARRLAMRAREIGQRCVSPYLVSHAETLICAAEFQQGLLRSAAQTCERNFAALKAAPRSPAWVNAAVTLACARYERGRLAEARSLLVEVLPHVSASSTLWVFSAAHIVLARLKAIDHKPGEALQLLDYAHSVLEDAGHPRYLAEICFEKVRLSLEQNDLARAELTAAEFSLPERAREGEWWQVRKYDESWGRHGFAAALLSMQQGDCDAARAVLTVLRDSAGDAGRVARRVSFDMALAMCHWHSGQDKAAYDVLNRNLVPNRQVGFSRAIFDEVPRFPMLLRAAVSAGKLLYVPQTRYFKEFAGVAPKRTSAPRPMPAAVAPPREPLTERELAILDLLSKGLCNKSISRCSGITLNTIKWHLRNVFAKLDATSRTSAVARARELRLID